MSYPFGECNGYGYAEARKTEKKQASFSSLE